MGTYVITNFPCLTVNHGLIAQSVARHQSIYVSVKNILVGPGEPKHLPFAKNFVFIIDFSNVISSFSAKFLFLHD